MPLLVPLSPVPRQRVQVTLNGQATALRVYQQRYGMFMDVAVNNTLIIGGVQCLNMNRIVRSAYLGFSGDFTFYDTQGTSDPDYSEIGTRYFLIYMFPDEVPPLGP